MMPHFMQHRPPNLRNKLPSTVAKSLDIAPVDNHTFAVHGRSLDVLLRQRYAHVKPQQLPPIVQTKLIKRPPVGPVLHLDGQPLHVTLEPGRNRRHGRANGSIELLA